MKAANKKKNIRLSTMQMLAAGFLGTIFLGGFLLWLPICNTKPISFLDALFTATTSVCVTGLVTVTPAVQFTMVGKVILLVLIQIGGLGVLACTIAFFILIKKRITVQERVVIQQAYSLDTLSGMVKFVIRIIKGTFFVEGIGAVLFLFQFIPEFGVAKGIWYSVFHAVSAFCNAGIDILGADSFTRYATNPLMNVTTISLIVVGGLGFIVWSDLKSVLVKVMKKKMPVRKIFHNLQLHTQIVLVMTVLLIVGGTLLIFALEFHNPDTMGEMTVGQKVMASLFHSVSTRTAGFATVSQSGLHEGTKFITCMLMFIGGSPAGTAGGIKTTTVAMLLLTVLTSIRGGRDTECFGRKISPGNIRTGVTVIIIAFSFLIGGTLLVTIFEGDIDFMSILYETTSAVGTVGLTADLTPTLSDASRIVIMILMYVGRIGPVTMALVFGGKGNTRDKIRELPERRILVG